MLSILSFLVTLPILAILTKLKPQMARLVLQLILYGPVTILVIFMTWGLKGWDKKINTRYMLVNYFIKSEKTKHKKKGVHFSKFWQKTLSKSITVNWPLVYKHFLVFYIFIKTTLLAVTLSVIYFMYTIFFFKIQFIKQLAIWFIVGMLYFWLISGFNFFLKRYKYGKFTSAIQRFWKRTNVYFWLIEGFLMLIFFYYYMNSSQEPIYMYDFSSLNQDYLVAGNVIVCNVIILSLIVYFMHFTLLRVNSNSWTQINLYVLIISIFIFISFFLETYQFYYVLNTFSEKIWSFNEEENMWAVDIDSPTIRTKHQYLLVCLIAKYWHFLFIFLSWVFFVIKSFERQKVNFVHLGANIQNIVILYVLNLVCYIQWVKWVYRRFFDTPYTWFFTNPDQKAGKILILEIKLLISQVISFNTGKNLNLSLIHKSSNLWQVNSLALWRLI